MNIPTTCLIVFFSIILTSCSGNKPMSIGNPLSPCPKSPNCISSQSQDESHYVAPFVYTGSQQLAFEQLVLVIRNYPRTKIVTETENYLHVECKSKWFGFIDDLEFLFETAQEIQVRSASRLGYSDFGVNRHRIGIFRTQFEKNEH